MARLVKRLNPALSQYRDRRFGGSDQAFQEALRASTTLYIGNLSFYTTEEQIYEVFSKAGDVQRIIMGLDKHDKTPCGFCFVVYYTREDAEAAVKYLNGTLVDERNIRVDIDWGFRDGRQFGRGKSGGQVRDEYRVDFDEGRGGFGQIVREEMRRHQAESVRQMDEYNLGQDEAPPSKRRRTSHARARDRDEDSEDD